MCALLHQNIQYLAMHGCAHNPASILIPSLIESEIAQPHLGLTPVAQHIDRVPTRYRHRVFCGRIAVDRNRGALRAINDLRHDCLVFGEDRQREPPRTRQLKGVGLIPWRGWFVRFPLA